MEQSVLTEALQNTQLQPVFETATAQSLGQFLSEGNPFLHFSCHGHPNLFFIEDDHGGVQTLPIGDVLEDWIQAGGSRLSVVFVSACHSRPAGESFVEARAPHVVCCEQADQMVSDVAAMIFARQFYVSLANGNTVQQAYDLAIHMVRQALEMKRTGLNVEKEANKFALLPEGADHNVSPFEGLEKGIGFMER